MCGQFIRRNRRLIPLARTKTGMTLVEIILAMAILAIVVVLMTPVMVSAFRMITLSGSRHEVAKGVAGNMEGVLAGNPVTTTLEGVSIAIASGISVDGSRFQLTDGTGVNYVDLNGYIIESMPVSPPTRPAATTATTAATTTDPMATGPTAEPTAPLISLDSLIVDVSEWAALYKYGTILSTTTQMDYMISEGGVDLTGWISCSDIKTTFFLSSNQYEYVLTVRQSDNVGNNVSFKIRKAPIVIFQADPLQNNYTCFYIYDDTTGGYRRVLASDNIELRLKPGDSFTRISSDTYSIKNSKLDRTTVYARWAITYDSSNVTIKDPASLPYKLDA